MNPERRPELESYSMALIKPDAYRDVLSQMIIADLEEAGLSIVFRKEMRLERHEAEFSYDEHRGSKNYPFMVESLMLKDKHGDQYPCMLLVLKSGEDDALGLTQKAKGRADRDGIRAKYRLYFWHELEEMGYLGDELSSMLARNRLHVPDDHQRMTEILGVLLTERDVDEISQREDQLGNIIREYKDSVPRAIIPMQENNDGVK